MSDHIKTYVERFVGGSWQYIDLTENSDWSDSWQQYSSFALMSGIRDRDSVGQRFSCGCVEDKDLDPRLLEEEWLDGISGPVYSLDWIILRDFDWTVMVKTTQWILGQGDVSVMVPMEEYASDLYDCYKFMESLENPEDLRMIFWYE